MNSALTDATIRPMPTPSGSQPQMTGRLLLWAITSALAGFLFGFDTVVISGAEQTIQALWGLSVGMHGIAMAAALYGTVVGSLVGAWPTDRYGRKATLLWIGVLYIVSAVGCGLAWNVHVFIAARVIGGIGIGISTVAAPLYISEIAPPTHRGRLAGMFQFNIVFGIVVAFLSNALLAGIGDNAWRWMLGVAAFPSIVYTLMCFAIPESPRWLLTRKGDRANGLRVLGLIEPDASLAELEAEADNIVAASSQQTSARGFWSMRLRVPITLAFLVAFVDQHSGINAILYYAPRILEMTGTTALRHCGTAASGYARLWRHHPHDLSGNRQPMRVLLSYIQYDEAETLRPNRDHDPRTGPRGCRSTCPRPRPIAQLDCRGSSSQIRRSVGSARSSRPA